MASTIGHSVRLAIFGQSHSEAIGCTVEGLPAGIEVDLGELQAFLERRAPGRSDTSTARREPDRPRILSGLVDGHTCGAPLAAIIENTNTRSRDYDGLRRVPRPGHADYPAFVRYGNHHDVAGGGHFSGRLTATMCIAGGIALQALAAMNIKVVAHIAQLGPERVTDVPLNNLAFDPAQHTAILANELPCIDADAARAMHESVLAAKGELDSVGGVIECAAYGMPAGIGDPMFDGLENRIASLAYGIPAVKGVEFGAGFGAAALRGSQNNDPYREVEGRVCAITNNAGGILGGISTGAPLHFRCALKPISSIGQEQDSVDLERMEPARLAVRGRHDATAVTRAVPVVEAVCALALADALLAWPAEPKA